MIRLSLIAFIMIPILLGMIGAIMPAVGYLPPLGGHRLSSEPLFAFMALPGINHSIILSLFTGLVATVLSTILAMILPGLVYGKASFRFLGRYLSPILSLPHITVAVGILFLLQPSGWLLRIISPYFTGFDRPPIDYIFPDQAGWALVVGLMAKEVPFLVLMTLSALSQINTRPMLTVARSMGYGPLAAWMYIIMPALWLRLRLPVLIVLVFSLSVVDMAIVLAPTTPPPLAVRVVTLYQDPDLSQRFVASVAAMVQMMIVLIGAIALFGSITIISRLMRLCAYAGYRFQPKAGHVVMLIKSAFISVALIPMVFAIIGLGAAILWTFAGRWRFPSAWPDVFTLRYWLGAFDGFYHVIQTTFILGFTSAFLGLVVVMIWLGAKQSSALSRHQQQRWTENLLFLPLVLPQIGFLFGIQIMLLWLRLDGSILALIWTHMLFVVPYIWLALAPSWRSFNPDWLNLAGNLGASPIRRFFSVRLPIMIQPVMVSLAIGFSVSAALYLPTVFAGNGQVITLTVEAVTLASGASRAQLGIATVFQMILPLSVYILAGVIAGYRTRRLSYFD